MTTAEFQNRIRTAQCKFSCLFPAIRDKRCLMIPVDTTNELYIFESLKLLNNLDARDFDEGENTWNSLTLTEIEDLLIEVEKKLC